MSAKQKQGMAALEEFLQEKYVEAYDIVSNNNITSELDILRTVYPEYFYQPTDETGLPYILNSGNMYFLIQKENLPSELQEQIVGGDAGDKTYESYANLIDVYGVTSKLKVYYCSNGLASLVGQEEKLKDSGDR